MERSGHAIGWLQRGYSSHGGGTVVRIPRIWMSSGEGRLKITILGERRQRMRRWFHYASWFLMGACAIGVSVNYFVFDPRKCIEKGGLVDAPPCVSGVIVLAVMYGVIAYLLPWVVYRLLGGGRW